MYSDEFCVLCNTLMGKLWCREVLKQGSQLRGVTAPGHRHYCITPLMAGRPLSEPGRARWQAWIPPSLIPGRCAADVFLVLFEPTKPQYKWLRARLH